MTKGIEMARRVYKYPLLNDGEPHRIKLKGNVVHIGYLPKSYEHIQIWAEHSDDKPSTEHLLQVFGPGDPIPPGAIHIGTTITPDNFVWHIYEVG